MWRKLGTSVLIISLFLATLLFIYFALFYGWASGVDSEAFVNEDVTKYILCFVFLSLISFIGFLVSVVKRKDLTGERNDI